MTSVAVSKSSPAVIKPPPSESATMARSGAGAIELTSFDSVFVNIPFTALLVFEHLSHEAHEATIGSIKKALSEALAHYHPFAGRICTAVDGDGFSIRCTCEGAEFVAASADCSLKEAKILETSSSKKALLLDELAVHYPFGSYGSDDPLLSVQVTEFSCGSLVLGVTWNHAVADGAGIGQFLAAVGELARGLPSSPSVTPARWDEAVSSLPPLPDPVLQATLVCPDTRDMELIVHLDVTIPSSLISRVKAESCSHFDGQPCTVFEVVLAVLWRCRVRATMASCSPGAAVYLTFGANMRKHVGAKDGYYGNCVTNQLLATTTSAAVASAAIMDLIKMIKRAKDQLPGKLNAEEECGGDDDGGQLMRGLGGRYDMLHVSSWRNIGFEQVDFGSGPPARVMFQGLGAPVPICVVYPPCKGRDGVNVLSISTREEHADTFLEELAKLA